MLITATTAFFILGIAVGCVTLGHYVKRLELYAFGVLLIFLFSGFIAFNGISEQTGTVAGLDANNQTVTTFTYEQNRESWVDFLVVGSMLLGVFLAINTYLEYTKERQRRREEDLDAR